MAIEWNGVDGLFTVLGKYVKFLNKLDVVEDTHIQDHVVEIREILETAIDNANIVGELQPLQGLLISEGWNLWRTVVRGIKQRIVQVHIPTLLSVMLSDQEGYIITDTNELLDLMFDRMVLDAQTIEENALTIGAYSYGREYGAKSATPSLSSNYGDWDLVLGFSGSNRWTAMNTLATFPWGEYPNEWIRHQELLVRCITGVNEGAANGTETFTVTGQEPLAGNVYAGDDGTDAPWEYEGNYGNVSIISERNSVHTDAGVENWIANEPDDWEVASGIGGTNYRKETTNFYRGAAAIEWINGAAGWEWYQEISGLVLPKTTYLLSFRLKCANNNIGATSVSLFVYSPGTPARYNTTEERATWAFTPGSDPVDWALIHAFVNIREIVDLDLRLRLVADSTAGAPSGDVWIDDCFFAPVTKLNGVSVCPIVGQATAYSDDMCSVEVTNDYNGLFQTFFGRFYRRSMPSCGLGGGPTINDALAS
jgi:hypothetical protein